MQLRDMISESFADIGVSSESWIRNLLPNEAYQKRLSQTTAATGSTTITTTTTAATKGISRITNVYQHLDIQH